MHSQYLQLSFRKLIAFGTTDQWEQQVLQVTYKEFLLKSQAYNPDKRWQSFREMKAADGRANSLHYKIGFAAAPYMQALQNKIPGLQDTLEQAIAFETWRLELVESDVKEPARHRIAVLFQTPTLQVLQVFGNQFVVKYANSPQVPDGAMHPCFTITWQAGMAINAISFDHTPSELAVLLS